MGATSQKEIVGLGLRKGIFVYVAKTEPKVGFEAKLENGALTIWKTG